MMPFTLVCILVMLALLLTTIPRILLLYRYTRPKIGPIKTMLKWEAGLVTLLLLGTIIPTVWPQGCAHPKPDLSSGNPTCISGSITLGGSTALQSLMSKVAHSYELQCPGASITVLNNTNQAGSQNDINKSEAGLDSVEDGSINIGTSDTFAPPDQSDLVDHEIAASVFVVIVNSDVRISNLSTSQIQGIYAGKYKNWQELGGPDLSISPLSRGFGSGTRFTFDTYILGGHELVPQPTPIPDTQTMINKVQKTPGAIGYADLYDVSVNPQSLIQITIDGVPASPFTVNSNNYKFWTVEHMYTKEQASGLAKAFIDYMGTDSARQIIQSSSFIDIYSMTNNALAERCPTNGS
jgi:phosphate transport system substrate-binding protein